MQNSQSFQTVVFSIFFGLVLLLSPHPVSAREALLAGPPPDYYFVKEKVEDAGETLLVYACKGKVQLEGFLTRSPVPLENAQLGCMAIEVSTEDLNQFILDLGHEANDLKDEHFWYSLKEVLTALGVIGSGVGLGIGGIEYYGHIFSPNSYSMMSKRKAITLALASFAVFGVSIKSFIDISQEPPHPNPTNRMLIQQLREGIVGWRRNKERMQGHAMELFTKFLNQHGQRVSSVAQVE